MDQFFTHPQNRIDFLALESVHLAYPVYKVHKKQGLSEEICSSGSTEIFRQPESTSTRISAYCMQYHSLKILLGL